MFIFGFEKFMAGETLIGLVHAVNGAHVGFEMRQLGEPGVRTHGAAEWFFTGVLADVKLENA